MDLVRDVLDKKVVDRNGREMGRVDRIVLQLQPGMPPRVAGIEIGPSALADRLGRLFGCAARAVECALGIGEGRPLRVPFADIDIADHVRVSVSFGETTAAVIEHRLRRVVGSIPFSS